MTVSDCLLALLEREGVDAVFPRLFERALRTALAPLGGGATLHPAERGEAAELVLVGARAQLGPFR